MNPQLATATADKKPTIPPQPSKVRPKMKDLISRQSAAPSFAELFTPKLVTVLREGYGLPQLRADAIAGLTVAIVALPLSMAIAIASGATPAQGLYTAIVGGFLVSLLGGSRFQIGGPAGAFIVLVAMGMRRPPRGRLCLSAPRWQRTEISISTEALHRSWLWLSTLSILGFCASRARVIML